MPKATAMWLINNTCLTFEQISKFCNLHIFEIEAMANENGECISEFSPITSSQLTLEEIKRCELNPQEQLQMKPISQSEFSSKRKYTFISNRKNKPNAIYWIIKYYPEIPDADICALLGTTKKTVHSIRNKTYKSIENLVPQNPVILGLCSEQDLDFIIAKLTRQ